RERVSRHAAGRTCSVSETGGTDTRRLFEKASDSVSSRISDPATAAPVFRHGRSRTPCAHDRGVREPERRTRETHTANMVAALSTAAAYLCPERCFHEADGRGNRQT